VLLSVTPPLSYIGTCAVLESALMDPQCTSLLNSLNANYCILMYNHIQMLRSTNMWYIYVKKINCGKETRKKCNSFIFKVT